MKKALSFVVMLIVSMSMTMMAQLVKIDLTQAPAVQGKDKVEWKVDNLTFTLAKGKSTHSANEKVNANGLVMYKDQELTISATGGTTIFKVTFQDSPMEAGPTPPQVLLAAGLQR